MAEEQHRCQAQEGHRLCANNCGFFGSPATMNFCSKCFRDLRLKEEQASSAKIAVEKSLSAPSSSSSTQTFITTTTTNVAISPPAIALPATAAEQRSPVLNTAAAPPPSSDLRTPPQPVASQPNRCSTCRKRVGLTGFRCRCGLTFCSTHRYPEQHGCTFDFKGVGREAIARANPLVKAEKLDKI